MKQKKSDKVYNNMAKAVAEYIMSMGGSAIVIGGVAIGKDPSSLKYNYFIQIKITGKMPTKRNL